LIIEAYCRSSHACPVDNGSSGNAFLRIRRIVSIQPGAASTPLVVANAGLERLLTVDISSGCLWPIEKTPFVDRYSVEYAYGIDDRGVAMMGQRSGVQERLFYAFNLDDYVPQDHLLRAIDRCLDLSNLRSHLAKYYSHTGRPSIDPELMVRLLLVGYCYGIRSERRLCEEASLNLAYRWFCRLGLEDPVPDHSTFSKNRHGRFRQSEAFRFIFDEIVRKCMSLGLVKGEGFAVDASVVSADASAQRAIPGEQALDWSDPCSRAWAH
jgi:transposase